MIFVTIGTQEPFDRLIKTVDDLACEWKHHHFVAQVANTKCTLRNIESFSFLSSDAYNYYFEKADIIVSHAGMGTIISALEKQKEIVVFPRLKSLGEHRSDHQLATAKRFGSVGYVNVANNETELRAILQMLMAKDQVRNSPRLGRFASPQLIHSIRSFISK